MLRRREIVRPRADATSEKMLRLLGRSTALRIAASQRSLCTAADTVTVTIAEAQAKIERRQRELDRRIWVASKQGDSAAAVAAFGLGGSANATDPNGSPSVILACGGGQVSPQDACAWICPAKMWMHLAMSILLHEYIGGARERH